MTHPYRILDRKRLGENLSAEEIQAIVAGAVDGSWSDAQLAAFLMAAAIHGLDEGETGALTRAMLDSGSLWRLSEDFPGLVDKHSTGGVGDKVSLILSPLIAACGLPVVMLTGRGLGHTGGTADKLETLSGLDLALDRPRCCRLLETCGMAIGVATDQIAPADRKLYALRDLTGTVVSIPLISASILSKKLATGAESIVFDVKTGSGAFMADLKDASRLAKVLVRTTWNLGSRASALVTDMSQPLGVWAGNACEIGEAVSCLDGNGPRDLMEVVYALAEELAGLAQSSIDRAELERAVDSGAARERFATWLEAQGGDPAALEMPPPLAPVRIETRTERDGFLASVDARRLGLLLNRAGGGRVRPNDAIDPGIALESRVRLGEQVTKGQLLARLHVRESDEALELELAACFAVEERPVTPPELILERVVGQRDR